VKLAPHEDAFGRALRDELHGQRVIAMLERDDGYVDPDPARTYLLPPRAWSPHQRAVLREVRGRVLDAGCGAGRHAVVLQARGHDVLGIDVSPLAIRTARERGLRRARAVALADFRAPPASFDTIMMFGNNFGLFANARRARLLLRRFHRMTSARGRILAESNDVYATRDPLHRRYQARNRARGRMSGQIRLRYRYRDLATPWFDYLMVSPRELRAILRGTGWSIRRLFPSKSPSYLALLEKE
jgi:SAM-dependent methyltransferase